MQNSNGGDAAKSKFETKRNYQNVRPPSLAVDKSETSELAPVTQTKTHRACQARQTNPRDTDGTWVRAVPGQISRNHIKSGVDAREPHQTLTVRSVVDSYDTFANDLWPFHTGPGQEKFHKG